MQHLRGIRPEVREQIARMSEEEILCRTIGHKWDPETTDVIADTYEVGLHCYRCGTERDKISGRYTGERLPNRYRKGPLYAGMVGIGFLSAEERTLITLAANEIIRRQNLPHRTLPTQQVVETNVIKFRSA
jgi:hypothetical protein